jgi:hypothetical protein
METIAQVFGITFVGIIMICLAYTIVEVIFSKSNKENKKT